MGLSELCIRRPVLTTLDDGDVYRLRHLCVSPAWRVGAAGRRLSDHPDHRDPAGRQRRNHGGVGRVADRAADGDDLRRLLADVDVVARPQHDRHPVRSRARHRQRGARRAERVVGRPAAAADRDDDAAELPEGQPGRFRGGGAERELGDAAAVDGQRLRRDQARPADFAAARRRPGRRLRLAAVRDPGSGRSGGRRGAQHLARRHPPGHRVRPIPTRRSARSIRRARTSR